MNGTRFNVPVGGTVQRRHLRPLPAPVARNATDGSPPMACRHVFDSIHVHANGDIVCWDADVHGKRVYGNVFIDRIADVYNGAAYREMRAWLLQSARDIWCRAVAVLFLDIDVEKSCRAHRSSNNGDVDMKANLVLKTLIIFDVWQGQ